MTEEQLEKAKQFHYSAKRILATEDGKAVVGYLKNYVGYGLPSIDQAEFDTTRAAYYDGQKSTIAILEALERGDHLAKAAEVHTTQEKMDFDTFSQQ